MANIPISNPSNMAAPQMHKVFSCGDPVTHIPPKEEA